MNEIGVAMLGAAARGTAFASVGLGLCLILRKRGPAASALVALATLVGMVGVSALALSPWPRWWGLGPLDSARSSVQADRRRVDPQALPPSPSDGPLAAIEADTDPVSAPTTTDLGPAFRDLGQALLRTPDSPRWGWRACVAVVAIAGVGVGLVRFALGLIAVALLRRGSRPLDDLSMSDLAAKIVESLGVGRGVDLRVAPGLATPATVGWLRPVVLLPEDWIEWDDRERHVVLSHEIAHIHSCDYISCIIAHFSLALNYYHPLAHWLVGRLRLEQELAADALGARLSGGNRVYLATLARLALRNEPRSVGWPARSFRPGRGTLLRRIEMLRDANEVREQVPLPRRTRVATLGTLVLAGLAIAGLRGPGSTRVAEAAQAPATPATSGGVTIEYGYIPVDTAMIAVFRPAELLANPDVSRILETLEPAKQLQATTGLKVTDVEQVTLLWTFEGLRAGRPPGPAAGAPSGAIFRMSKPQDWKAVLTKSIPQLKEAKFGESTYYQIESAENIRVSSPDSQTLVIAQEPMLFRILTAKPGATDRAPWAEAWKAIKKGQVALAVDVTALPNGLNPRNAGQPISPLGIVGPLFERASAYALSVDATKMIAVDGIAICNNENNAMQVADTLKACLTLGRNALDSFRDQAGRTPAEIKILIDLGHPFLDKAAITTEGRTVHLSSAGDIQLAQAIQMLVPSVQTQRDGARRAQSVNSMKQIGLAFYNYQSTHGSFPAAANLGPDGKTPHSWRVAILPFIDQNDLYQQYKLDEPWDSPSNRKVLDKMPAVYRHPSSKSTTSPSYFVFTGKETLFPGNEGSKIADITDGTSTTILAVEADRDIPWTKPEDIPFDPNGPVPKLGGFQPNGFSALFADGSVKSIKATVNPVVLKALITRASGEVINSTSY